MKTSIQLLILTVLLLLARSAGAQVNGGSDGHDGAFNPTTNTVINRAGHPDDIYQYIAVNIPVHPEVVGCHTPPAAWGHAAYQRNAQPVGPVPSPGGSEHQQLRDAPSTSRRASPCFTSQPESAINTP